MITIKNPHVNYDKYGHCVACHVDLRFKQVVEGKEIWRLSPKYMEEEFLLDSGSKMRVAICKDCYPNLDPTDFPKIMEAVVKGWEIETNFLVKSKDHPNWDKKSRDRYLEDFGGLEIVVKSKEIKKDVLEKELIKFRKNKKKRKKNGPNPSTS